MSVTRLASLADLPAELRDRILKKALRYDFDAMRDLCKVSKGLNEPLKPQLYEIIESASLVRQLPLTRCCSSVHLPEGEVGQANVLLLC